VGTTTKIDPRRILCFLGGLGISSVLLEGGAITAGEFLRNGLVDRLYAFIAPSIMGEGIQGISFGNQQGMDRLLSLKEMGWIPIGKDLCITGRL
jgi:diaminohydroxyphosphoribosylaminopyrimidine deaminase/5-amino-6-(5-phosphoribosylamino)uracil reductase